MDDPAACLQFSRRHRPCHIDIEGDGEHEHIADQGIDGEKGGIVEQLKVQHAMRSMRGVEEIRPHLDGDVGRALAHVHGGGEVVIYGCRGIHALQPAMVFFRSQLIFSLTCGVYAFRRIRLS